PRRRRICSGKPCPSRQQGHRVYADVGRSDQGIQATLRVLEERGPLQVGSDPVCGKLLDELAGEHHVVAFQSQADALLDQIRRELTVGIEPGEGTLALRQAARSEPLFGDLASEALGLAELDACSETLTPLRIRR